jgi:hypothetical protein
MILYKNGVCEIVARKQKNGLYTITQKTKRVWGRMYDEKVLRIDISKNDLQNLKNQLATF